jgi:hypothetical protein
MKNVKFIPKTKIDQNLFGAPCAVMKRRVWPLIFVSLFFVPRVAVPVMAGDPPLLQPTLASGVVTQPPAQPATELPQVPFAVPPGGTSNSLNLLTPHQANPSAVAPSYSIAKPTEKLLSRDTSGVSKPEPISDAVRTAGKARLEAIRKNLAQKKSSQDSLASIESKHARAASAVPRKTELAPLPTQSSEQPPVCEKVGRIDELRGQIAAEPDPELRDQYKLVLAAHYVGLGDWYSAKNLYDELQANSKNPAILKAVERNLLVTHKQLQVLAENDPARREQLQLELAELHYDLGHEQAAKHMANALAQSAHDPEVKARAVELHQTDRKPSNPPVPLNLMSHPTIDPSPAVVGQKGGAQ